MQKTPATHQALYLTYRPQTFADVAGQAPVVVTLLRALAGKRVSHAYLFAGPRGTGKTTTARLLAKGINCEKPGKDGGPCGKCGACVSIAEGNALDLIEIDAASNRGIDEIRELRDKVAIAPTAFNRKVYIIDEVHMLTKEAFNALLKTLEEPPEFVTFILATTEPEKVPQTIISRCQRFDFRPAAESAVAKRLTEIAGKEKIKLDPEAAELIARQAQGSFRDALSILDLLVAAGGRVTSESVRETLGLAGSEHLAALENALIARDHQAALRAIRTASQSGVAPDTFRRDIIDLLRHRLRAVLGVEPVTEGADVATQAWDPSSLIVAIRAFTEAGEVADGAELALELAALEIAPPGESPTSLNKDKLTKPPRAEEPRAQKKSAGTSSGAKQSGPGKPPKDAQAVWEKLLEATKHQYSLSVSLQRTRPKKLDKSKLYLDVYSEFFLKKLDAKTTREKVEAECQKLLGRKIAIELSLAEQSEDVFEGALATFEGAEAVAEPSDG